MKKWKNEKMKKWKNEKMKQKGFGGYFRGKFPFNGAHSKQKNGKEFGEIKDPQQQEKLITFGIFKLSRS